MEAVEFACQDGCYIVNASVCCSAARIVDGSLRDPKSGHGVTGLLCGFAALGCCTTERAEFSHETIGENTAAVVLFYSVPRRASVVSFSVFHGLRFHNQSIVLITPTTPITRPNA